MKIAKPALIATATISVVIALPATAQADPSYQPFKSPSGNISCVISVSYKLSTYANCTVQDPGFVVAPELCGLPSPVRPQFVLTEGKAPELSCVTGAKNAPVSATLDYGQTRSTGPIACESEPDGVTCTDSGTGRFFRVSRDSYQLG